MEWNGMGLHRVLRCLMLLGDVHGMLVFGRILVCNGRQSLTFYHPPLKVGDSHDGRDTEGGNGGDGLVHGGIYMSRRFSFSFNRSDFHDFLWLVHLAIARHLPSILPCSQSTMTQSTPDRARILEMLAPGSICHKPMEGPLFSAKTCLRRFAWSIWGLVPGSMAEAEAENERLWLALLELYR